MKYNNIIINNENQISTFPIQRNNEQLLGLSSQNDIKVINNKYFNKLIEEASLHPRKRKMTDLTKDPKDNSMQVLINTWLEGSYSPIHYHDEYSEVFQILDGDLAFFTFTDKGVATCNILSSSSNGNKAIIVEKKSYHGMTAAPKAMGYSGYAIVFENSGHNFNPNKNTKKLAPWATSTKSEYGLDGDSTYFSEILKLCPSNNL